MDYIKAYTASWLSHRKALEALIAASSDEHLSYKPWEDGMSFSELVLHTVRATSMFINIVATGENKQSADNVQPATIAELGVYVQELTEKSKAQLESLTEEQLNKTVEFASMKMTGQAMLEMSKEHEIHHKGQLFTYARICGVKDLPFFISR